MNEAEHVIYIIVSCPDTGIVNDKGNAFAGFLANMQGAHKLCGGTLREFVFK